VLILLETSKFISSENKDMLGINDLDISGNIKLSTELLFLTSEENKSIYLVDPKTLALLDTYSAVKLIHCQIFLGRYYWEK
jgi:hypothetical protein